ncbi:MAG TPA: cell division topological specificity factor MinE [Thermomicrobiaceae bacterium]|nr:cell division topological specificity factor MinE [Thermomicrobiaceae bacterium]
MGFLDTLLGRHPQPARPVRPPSASVAKQRLVEVLIQDHVKLTPEAMEAIRRDIVKILSRHLDVDADRLQINITRGERGESLVANVPVRRGGLTGTGRR